MIAVILTVESALAFVAHSAGNLIHDIDCERYHLIYVDDQLDDPAFQMCGSIAVTCMLTGGGSSVQPAVRPRCTGDRYVDSELEICYTAFYTS